MHFNPVKFYADVKEYGLKPALGLAKKFKTNKMDAIAEGMLEFAGAVTLPEDATSFRIPLASSEEGDLMTQFSGSYALCPVAQADFVAARTNKLKM